MVTHRHAVRTFVQRRLSGSNPLLQRATSPAGLRVLTDAERDRYRADPIAWAVEVMGLEERTLRWSLSPEYSQCFCPWCVAQGNAGKPHIWDGTPDPLVAAASALARGMDCAFAAGTGTQKTHSAAWLAMWFIDTHYPSQVITLGPSEDNLLGGVWKWIPRLHPRFKAIRPSSEILHLELRVDPDDPAHTGWGVIGRTARVRKHEESSTVVQGIHEEWVLFILEETPGLSPSVLVAVRETANPGKNLRFFLGNPDFEGDNLDQAGRELGVERVSASCLDHPNYVTGDEDVVPGATTRAKVARALAKHTETGRLYLSRTRGKTPTDAEDTVIRRAWLYVCRDRGKPEMDRGPEDVEFRAAALRGAKAWGLDWANSLPGQGDKGALAEGVGHRLFAVPAFSIPDADAEAERLALRARDERVAVIGADNVGIGAAPTSRVRKLTRGRCTVHGLGGADGVWDTGPEEEEFANLRAQMYWQFRRDAYAGEVILPDDEELFADLSAPKWSLSGNKILIEPKDAVAARLGRSPNKGDAAVYWNWIRTRRKRPSGNIRDLGAMDEAAEQMEATLRRLAGV